MRFLSRVAFKYVVPWVLCHLFMREVFLNLAGKERFATPVVFVVCTGAFQRYWFVAPALGIGEAKAQAQTTCAVSKLVFHGCQVSGVFHHNDGVQSLPDCRIVWELQYSTMPAHRREGSAYWRLFLPEEGRVSCKYFRSGRANSFTRKCTQQVLWMWMGIYQQKWESIAKYVSTEHSCWPKLVARTVQSLSLRD